MKVDKFYIADFLLAGNCDCKIMNTISGNVFEYTIKKNDRNPNMYFVLVREGRSNFYAGVLYIENGKASFATGAKGKLSKDDMSIKALLYTLNNVDRLPDCVEVHHMGKCAKCHRRLTDDLSIERGLGPECWKKVHG